MNPPYKGPFDPDAIRERVEAAARTADPGETGDSTQAVPLTAEEKRQLVIEAMPWYDDAHPNYTELDAAVAAIEHGAVAHTGGCQLPATHKDCGFIPGLLEWSPLLDATHEEDGTWSVSVKAMPGHVGAADTLQGAINEAATAAELWVATARTADPGGLREWVLNAGLAFWDERQDRYAVLLDDLERLEARTVDPGGLRKLADGIRYVGPHSDDAYWRGLNNGIEKMLAALASSPTAPERTGLDEARQHVIDVARELNMTMPDQGDGDPLSDLDDALIVLDAALASQEPGS